LLQFQQVFAQCDESQGRGTALKETQAIIERVRRVNSTHQHLHLAVDASLSRVLPGQTLLARVGNRWEPYLREQWWPVAIGNNQLVVERPVESSYQPGEVVNVLGVVGQPLKFRRTLRNVLLLAYDTAPTPLLMPIPRLLNDHVSVTLVLLGAASQYGTEHLPPEVEVIHGGGSMEWPNRVTTVGWADQVFVAVPPDTDLHNFALIRQLFAELRAEVPAAYLFGVFRPTLPCGVGACSACMIRLKGNTLAFACTDGPAFDLNEVIFP
jgi:hypothetical protein